MKKGDRGSQPPQQHKPDMSYHYSGLGCVCVSSCSPNYCTIHIKFKTQLTISVSPEPALLRQVNLLEAFNC